MSALHTHDEVYVVSDLHLGDLPARSIFQDTRRLAGLILHLAEQPSERDIALVLAGDIVDFLAEEQARRFDPMGASAKLRGIVERFKPVFDALRVFTSRAGRRLVVLVGNHDIELGLPTVTDQLVATVASDDASRGRVHLGLHGEGYRCDVGGRSVFAVHGNEVDDWNYVDDAAVQRAGLSLQREKTPDDWEANPGSTLVIEVMNDIKRRYPFVDMLKPEDVNLVGVLLALEPGVALKLAKLPTIVARGPITLLKKAGWLSAEDVDAEGTPGSQRASGARRAPTSAADIQRELAAGIAGDLTGDARDGREQLGAGSAIVRGILGLDNMNDVRDAMQKWHARTQDHFNPNLEDDTSRKLDEVVSPEMDIVIAGHTHVRRALPRRARGRTSADVAWYFNSGTWITMFALTADRLMSEAAFKPVWESLKGKNPSELLAMPDSVVRRMATAVRVWRDGASVRAGLFEPDADGRPIVPVHGAATALFKAR